MICTISLLGSGKMEENKENDLQPPVPQSYAATVARQSTVPSTSTMPGEHHMCPSLGATKPPGAKWKVSHIPRAHPGSPQVHCTLGQQDFGAHWVHPLPHKQGTSFLLCFLCQLCSLCHRRAQGRAGTTLWQTAAAARWFPGVVTMGVGVRAYWFCVSH